MPLTHLAQRPRRRGNHRLAVGGRTATSEFCHVLMEHAPEAISLLTPTGVVLDVNHRWEEIRQLPREALIGTHIRDFAAPGCEDSNDEVFYASAGRSTTPSAIVPIRAGDGRQLLMEFSTVTTHAGSEPVVLSIGRDVTQLVEARKQLEASERKYRLLIENIPDVIWVATFEGKVLYMSPRVEAICGFTPDEFLHAPASFWFDRIHPDDVDAVRAAYDVIASDNGYAGEYRWLRKDGEWIWIRSQATVTERDGARVVEGSFEDVTQRHFLEDQVRQSQKMEAIGQLTGGVAHDFNNILAVILGNGRFLLDELPPEDPRRADALAVVEAGERAANLTRQLLMFSRRQVVRREPLELNGIVRGLEKMLRRIIGEDIELSLGLTEAPTNVVADAGEIEQVIMNLVVNARDAMPDGGRVLIETARVELTDEYAELHPDVEAGRYMLLSVADTGCGMDVNTRRHAFEPFFTTKGQGRGTGLGLATCYGIVRGCHGQITVYSEVGHGTVFKIYLPEVAPPSGAGAALTDVRPDVSGHETVLLVEDDDALRRTIARILTSNGFMVLESSGGSHALTVADRFPGTIDLVISDMVMPGLNGPDSVARIREHRPSVKVLYMSGYSDHAILRHDSTEVAVNFIQKPFAPRGLLSKVRQILDGGQRVL